MKRLNKTESPVFVILCSLFPKATFELFSLLPEGAWCVVKQTGSHKGYILLAEKAIKCNQFP